MWQRSADAGILPSMATPGVRVYLEVTSLVFAMPLLYVAAHFPLMLYQHGSLFVRVVNMITTSRYNVVVGSCDQAGL
jgi:hypothetical protein